MTYAHQHTIINPEQALPGRSQPLPHHQQHAISGLPLQPIIPEHYATAYFAMGCFWGVERLFWQQPGVYHTSVGYMGGYTPNPTYQEVCTGLTGHAEAVQVIFDPAGISYAALLQLFWERHDPTQGMRQGNDLGTQYRSALYTCDEAQQQQAEQSAHHYQQALAAAGHPNAISTEIRAAGPFYLAEDEHQQYLFKHPHGYCGLGGTGICFPAGG